MHISRLACVQDWHDQGRDAAWRSERPGPVPYKRGNNPFFVLPNGSNPKNILIDVAHTFHIKGFGVDFCASAVVLMCHKQLFGRDILDRNIYQAYCKFMSFIHATKKSTGCRPWMGRLQFDMATNNAFPTSISGKGFDTALCCSWIESFLALQEL